MEHKEIPKVVYKYRKWDNDFHKRILMKNEVYYSSPRDFEDELDCYPPVIYPEGQELFMYLLKYSMNNYLNRSIVWHIWNATEMYKRSPLSLPYELQTIETGNKDAFNKRFGVLSLTTDCNNDAMWDKYADNHKGFCVGFDTNRLFASRKGGCGAVNYYETLPAIIYAKDSLDVKIIKTIYNKEKKWEFEHEFRFHTMWQENEKIERNCRLQWNTIVEIILGKNMPTAYREEIKEIVGINHPNAQIIEE